MMCTENSEQVTMGVVTHPCILLFRGAMKLGYYTAYCTEQIIGVHVHQKCYYSGHLFILHLFIRLRRSLCFTLPWYR